MFWLVTLVRGFWFWFGSLCFFGFLLALVAIGKSSQVLALVNHCGFWFFMLLWFLARISCHFSLTFGQVIMALLIVTNAISEYSWKLSF